MKNMRKIALLPLFLLAMSFVEMKAFAQETMLLLSPRDQDTIHTFNPLLSWSILSPVTDQSGRSFYRLLLTEKKQEQSASAAIILNQPMLKMDGMTTMQLFYPYDAPELEAGKHYAWQLQKIVNNVITEKSEAYSFYIPLPEKPVLSYYKMKTKSDGAIYDTKDGKLHVEFKENYNDEKLEFYVYDDKNNLVQSRLTIEQETGSVDASHIKKNGANYYTLVYGKTLKKGVYTFVAYNAKKQKYQVQFRVD
jgi:hypothetical protein